MNGTVGKNLIEFLPDQTLSNSRAPEFLYPLVSCSPDKLVITSYHEMFVGHSFMSSMAIFTIHFFFYFHLQDLERLDLSPYKYVSVNITGYRIVDMTLPNVQTYLKKWTYLGGHGRGANHPMFVSTCIVGFLLLSLFSFLFFSFFRSLLLLFHYFTFFFLISS